MFADYKIVHNRVQFEQSTIHTIHLKRQEAPRLKEDKCVALVLTTDNASCNSA